MAYFDEEKHLSELSGSRDLLLSSEVGFEREKHFGDESNFWNRQDFHFCLRKTERHVRRNLKNIAAYSLGSKYVDEIVAYSEAFWEKIPIFIVSWSCKESKRV